MFSVIECLPYGITAGQSWQSTGHQYFNPCSQSAAFSALRVWALTRHNFWLSGIVLLLSLVPFVENVVRPPAIPVSGITSEHSEVSIYSGIKPLYHGVLP